MNLASLKESATAAVEANRPRLIELSQRIHAHPELGFKEKKAMGWLTQLLEEAGFVVERGVAELPTAFRARFGSGGPVVAFLAEYDALPKLGHACGHNLIATSAVGGALAAKEAVTALGGTVVVVGTPAEEIHGGKAYMVDRGAFSDVDVAMLVHPSSRTTVIAKALALVGLEVEFFGKAAHAAARPADGINALEALILSYNNINALREHVKDRARIHGIITDGGEAANIVPAHVAGSFLVRAEDDDYLEVLRERVLQCFQAGALATGARLEYRWAEVRYRAMRTNLALAELFAQNLRAIGREVLPPGPDGGLGSTDMGNVSVVLPAIHPSIAICPDGVAGHSPEFALAAASEEGHRGMLDAAKALAMTGIDLLGDPKALEKVKKAFLRGNGSPQG